MKTRLYIMMYGFCLWKYCKKISIFNRHFPLFMRSSVIIIEKKRKTRRERNLFRNYFHHFTPIKNKLASIQIFQKDA